MLRVMLTKRTDPRNAGCLYAVLCGGSPIMADSASFDGAWSVFQDALRSYPNAEAWLWESPEEKQIARKASKREVDRFFGAAR